MPGRPKRQALVAYLAEVADDEPRVTTILARIASGESAREVAETLRVPFRGGVWTPSQWELTGALRDHYETEYGAAKNARGEARGDIALDTLKRAAETREGVAKAREIANMYKWLAGKDDPATYGDTPAIALQVNNPGNLFLQAVARPGALPPAPKQIESGDARGVRTAPPKSDDDAESQDD
jgi:terminase small subunit-like protein